MIYDNWRMNSQCFNGMQNHTSCIPQETVINNVKLARAYVPFQKFCTLYPPDVALQRGTVFPELYSPYFKEKDMEKISLMEECSDDYE